MDTDTAPYPTAQGFTLGRRVTPAAALVWSGDPIADRAAWLDVRRNGIGSSDAAAITCPSKWGTALDVWLDKTNSTEDRDAGEAAEWGNIMEEPIARKFAARTGYKVQRMGTVANIDNPWRMANVDRRVMGHAPGGCPLEIKTRSAFKAGQWVEEIPDDVYAQTQWQMLVTGWDHAHVAVLIGGNTLRLFVAGEDAAVQRLLAVECDAVWTAVLEGTPPTIDPDTATLDVAAALDRIIGHLAGSVEIEPAPALRHIDGYLSAARTMKDAEAERDQHAAALAVLLNGAEAATIAGRVAYTRKPGKWSGLDQPRIKTEHPDVYAACYIKGRPTKPQLKIAAAFKTQEDDA